MHDADPEDVVDQHGQEEIMLPALMWHKKHDLGEIAHTVRSERAERIVERTTIRVSPRIEQPLLILESGEHIVLTTRQRCPVPEGVDGVVREDDTGLLVWQYHRELSGQDDPAQWAEKKSEVSESWKSGIRYASEHVDHDGNLVHAGLRAPQIGALHAIGAHWSLYSTPATIVMPTGTGKTETMIATLVGQVKGTFFVVVPSSPLRSQTVKKFLTLGLLRKLRVIPEDMPNPIVGVINNRPRSESELDIFESCHVVVSTMAAVSQGTATKLVPEMAERSSCLVVDEAHHVGAKSWAAFRDEFQATRVLQFTATPFRRDGILVDGDVIYSYPLRRAQEDQYFKPIKFDPVCEIEPKDADRAIAEKAITQLGADLEAGFDHLLMARCNRIERATEILRLYQELAPGYDPILVHSEDSSSGWHLQRLYSRDSRIVVCVEMLGEGFDMPQLKIAAIHDTHKSLAVLLQFTGRFTRTAGGVIGDATVVANIADQDVSAGLERLYSENADWNTLLAEMSSDAVREHRELVEFLSQSVPLTNEVEDDALASISPALLRPKFSVVTYRASEFKPRRFHRAVPVNTEVHRVWLHDESSTLYYVTKTEPPVRWTRAQSIQDREWHLYVVHYDDELGLLFIHSSEKSCLHENLAKVVGGQDVSLVRGDSVFRTLSGINRLQFQNVGVTKHARRNLRFAMYTGADVRQALEISQTVGSTKSVLQGAGYESGLPVAIGCSFKGRVWSKERGTIAHLTKWCKRVGAKLIDSAISTDEILQNVLVPEEITQFPEATVLTLEWPLEILQQQEERVQLIRDGIENPLSYFDLRFDEIGEERQAMRFYLEYDGQRSEYVFRLGIANAYEFTHVAGPALSIGVSRRELPLSDFLNDYPILVRFSDLSELDGHLLIKPEVAPELSFPAECFDVWDWSGIDVTRESLWRDGQQQENTVQARAAQHFIDAGYEVVFDDDASGEAADLICFKVEEEVIHFSLVHCKFTENVGGARLQDAVEVCSQAVRSGRWLWKFKDLCRHIARREQRLRSDIRPTRFLHGGTHEMNNILRASRFKEIQGRIIIVQPGISRTNHSDRQATILAAAHSFLMDTVGVSLDVVCAE